MKEVIKILRTLTKEDLRTGMIVKTGNNGFGIICCNNNNNGDDYIVFETGGQILTENYGLDCIKQLWKNKDMGGIGHSTIQNSGAVFKGHFLDFGNYELIYDADVKQLTHQQLENILGYRFITVD